MLLWYRTLAYLALHREANLILSNGKVTALPTVFNPVVKLARTEAYRQERAASSTKLFIRQSSKQLLSGQNAYGVWNVSRAHRNILSAPRGKSKRRRQKKAGEQQAVPGGCPSLHSLLGMQASCSPPSRACYKEDKAFQREFAAAPCCFPLQTEQF